MRIILPFVTIFFLSACVPASPSHSGNGQHRTTISGEKREVTIQDQSDSKEITFSVKEKGKTFTDYGISHTKQMHLIVVRDDLRYFHHLHPTRDAADVWHVPFIAPAGGTYWLYADFVDGKGSQFTLRFERVYQGKPGETGIVKNFVQKQLVPPYSITLTTDESPHGIQFSYKISDRNAGKVTPEEYLGALGHSVLISPSGDFIHTHPSEEREANGMVTFETAFPSESFYRMFTQFQLAGKVYTIHFDWEQLVSPLPAGEG